MAVKQRNPGLVEFDGKRRREEGGGSFVDFPYDVEKLYGVMGRVPVSMTFDGSARSTFGSRMSNDRKRGNAGSEKQLGSWPLRRP